MVKDKKDDKNKKGKKDKSPKNKKDITLENLQDKRKNIDVHLLVIMMIVIQVVVNGLPDVMILMTLMF